MGNHKNQHFVLQFYLKGFSSDRKTIGTLILSSKKFVKDSAIKDQCSKNKQECKNSRHPDAFALRTFVNYFHIKTVFGYCKDTTS